MKRFVTYAGAVMIALWTLVPIYWIFTISIDTASRRSASPRISSRKSDPLPIQALLGFLAGDRRL